MNATDPLADWLVKFGAAEMVIAYSPDSRFFNDLEKFSTGEIPWYQVLNFIKPVTDRLLLTRQQEMKNK